jgi:hypothetical protein
MVTTKLRAHTLTDDLLESNIRLHYWAKKIAKSLGDADKVRFNKDVAFAEKVMTRGLKHTERLSKEMLNDKR